MSARQQVRVPRPPEGDDGPRGSRAGVLDSYRHDIVRVVTAGGTVDIVPNHGADVAEPPGALSQVDRGVDDVGPFTGSSMRAALVWEHHRAMLVAALGCSICAGGNVATQGRPYGITDMV